MSIVICKLPKAGLGNQLFPLFKAIIFAHNNQLPLKIVGYNRIHFASYLRRDKSKRDYNDYFTFQKNIINEWLDKRYVAKVEKELECIYDCSIDKVTDPKYLNNKAFIFSKIPHWNDYFDQLKPYRVLVIELLKTILKPSILELVNNVNTSIIGAHIRMGDFRKLNTGEDFKKVGGVRTPEQYFIDIIQEIRKIKGFDVPVSVFTDGYKSELKQLFELSNIKLIEGNPDIVDLLQLSKSKIIITSAGSTFSYWAGFLSEALIIMHPDHMHQPIRPDSINFKLYEGEFSSTDIDLKQKIENIR